MDDNISKNHNRKERILLVEDEVGMSHSLTFLLQSNGYEVLQASNGYQALKKILENYYQDLCIDLVVLDIQMPYMTGFELLEEISFLQLDISILVITGYTDKKTISRLQEFSSIDYLKKPFNPDEFKETIRMKLQECSV